VTVVRAKGWRTKTLFDGTNRGRDALRVVEQLKISASAEDGKGLQYFLSAAHVEHNNDNRCPHEGMIGVPLGLVRRLLLRKNMPIQGHKALDFKLCILTLAANAS